MSTILKALRRLEQDKAAEGERPLQNAVVEGGAPASPAVPSRVRWLAIVLGAVAFGAGGVLWLQRGGDVPPALPPPVAAAPPAALPEPPVALAPALPESPVEPVDKGGNLADEAALALEPLPEAPAEDALVVPEVAAAPPADAIVVAPGPIAVAPPADPAPRLESFPAPPIEVTSKRVARAEPQPTAPRVDLPIRADSELAGAVVGGEVIHSGEEQPLGEDVRSAPQPRRRAARAPASFPVVVVRTVWHPKAERRTALLAEPDDTTPREYREGDRVGSLTLLRIEPSGVIFEKDGAEVRQKIGRAATN